MAEVDRALCNPGLLGRVLDCVRDHVVPGTDLATLTRDDLRHYCRGPRTCRVGPAVALGGGARQHTAGGAYDAGAWPGS
jgi:hypothetical protein